MIFEATPIGTDTIVNTTTTGNQQTPAIAKFANGSYIVVWDSAGAILGQAFDVAGNPVGAEESYASTSGFAQHNPQITVLALGGYVVTWESEGRDGDGWGLYGVRYTAGGLAVTNEMALNTTTTGAQSGHQVTALNDGGFYVVWTDATSDGDGTAIVGQRFNASINKIGAEQVINTTTTSDQIEPSIAKLADGGMMVVWASGDGDGNGVFAQFLAATGVPVGDEFQVSTTTANNRMTPVVTALADGGALVTWVSDLQDGSGWGVFGQRYDNLGEEVGVEFSVNTTTAGEQYGVTTTALPDGGFIVAWQSSTNDGSGFGIVAQHFDVEGNKVGDEFLVNSTTVGQQTTPVLMTLKGGDVVAVFTTDGVDGTEIHTRLIDATANELPKITSNGGQNQALINVAENETTVTTVTAEDGDEGDTVTFSITGGADMAAFTIDADTGLLTFVTAPNFEDATDSDENNVYNVIVSTNDGNGGTDSQTIDVKVTNVAEVTTPTPIGVDILVNTATTGRQENPYAAKFADGSYVVVWEGTDAHQWGIKGQRYDANGVKVGGEFNVNSGTTNDQFGATVAVLNDGSFVVTWQGAQGDGDVWGVYGQRFNADGSTAGSEFRVNTKTAGWQSEAVTTAMADGGFYTVWSDSTGDAGTYAVIGQRFDATGTKIGGEQIINTSSAGEQRVPSVTTLADGKMVVTWTTPDASGTGIAGQVLDTTGAKVGGEFTVNTATTGDQTYSGVTAMTDGGFLVTWAGQDGSGFGLFGQRYDATGAAVGSEFQVNTTTSGEQYAQAVLAQADGGFFVAWQSSTGDSDGWGAVAQRFDANNDPMGGEFVINATTAGSQANPFLMGMDNGTILALFHGAGPNQSDVFSRLIVTSEPSVDPTITSNEGGATANIELGENRTFVTTVTANDPDAEITDTISYMLAGGDDMGDFTINAATGVLRFVDAPDFEAPNDDDGNNVYEVIVRADDGKGGSDTQAISVTITNDDGIVITSNDAIINGTNDDDTLTGGVGNNTLNGLDGNDTLDGSYGNDILDGGTGADLMIGGSGNDTYYVDSTSDQIVEQKFGGTDTVLTALNAYSLAGFANVENLTFIGVGNFAGTGNDNVNTILGGAGNDTLNGLGGADTMTGGLGNDTYFVDNNSDSVVEAAGAGYDTIHVVGGSVRNLSANVEDVVYAGSYAGISKFTSTGNTLGNTMTGGSRVDWLNGGAGNDILDGKAGNDKLVGGAGNDRITGGAGNDTLYGGAGRDKFYFSSGFGHDTIKDFRASGAAASKDWIEFDNSVFTSFAQVLAKADQVGRDVVITVSSSHTIEIDNVKLSALSSDDFIFST